MQMPNLRTSGISAYGDASEESGEVGVASARRQWHGRAYFEGGDIFLLRVFVERPSFTSAKFQRAGVARNGGGPRVF